MILVVAPGDAARAIMHLAAAGETVHRIGAVVSRAAGMPATIVA